MITELPLAATLGSSLFLIIVGVVVAGLLVAAIWFGIRRVSARRAAGATPPTEPNPPARARRDSWETPDDRED
ncbi:DUF6479 family protein [Streptomyces sp. NPDC054975]